MRHTLPLALFAAGVATACATSVQQVESPSAAAVTLQPAAACVAEGDQAELSSRISPLDSVSFVIGSNIAKLCYSRPSARGRMVFDSLVRYGRTWRTGANEPTMLHLPVAAEVAGVRLAPGRYVILTIPQPGDWTIVFNTTEETNPNRIFNNLVEVARGVVSGERTDSYVEKFTIRPTAAAAPTDLVMEWERTRVRVPVRVTQGP